MSYLRGAPRMVTQTINDYVVAQLTALGWFGATGSLPYGATQSITMLDYIPQPNGLPTEYNTVAFTNGTENDDKAGELGAASGGLWSTDYVFFLDIFAENQSISLSIAADIKAILTGKLPGTNRFQPVTDYSLTPPAPAEGYNLLEFLDVIRTRPEHNAYQRDWQIIKFTAQHWFEATEAGG